MSNSFTSNFEKAILEWRISVQKIAEELENGIKAADVIMDLIEKRDAHEPESAPVDADQLWRWAKQRGISHEEWKGTAMGLHLKGTRNLTQEEFARLSREIHNRVRSRQHKNGGGS